MTRFRAALLVLFPLFEVFCGQIQGLWAPTIGPLSFAQAYHCLMLCVAIVYLLSRLHAGVNRPLIVEIGVVGFMIVVAASTLVSLERSIDSHEDIIAFSQILYWITIWLVFAMECSTDAGCRAILTGVSLAGVYMAVSVIVFFMFGGDTYSKYESVESSFGGFSTAKSLSGILCTAALLGFRARSLWRRTAVLVVCLVALMLTYQRAGQLAMLGVALWLIVVSTKPIIRRTVFSRKSLALLALVLVIVGGTVDREALASRWSDITHSEKAGSGRLSLWSDALHAFQGMNWSSRILGVGYSGMRDVMSEEGMGGKRKHTHSDLLDVLLAFGLLGVLTWIGVHGALIGTLIACPRASIEFVVGVSVYIVFFIESLVTGQVFGAGTMIAYIGAITALSRVRSSPLGIGILRSGGVSSRWSRYVPSASDLQALSMRTWNGSVRPQDLRDSV